MIVFNSSMPRSGSELLQALLSQHPQVAASSTSPLLEYVFGAYRNLTSTEEARSQGDGARPLFEQFVDGGIRSYADRFIHEASGGCDMDKDTYIDKSRGWIYYYPLLERAMGARPKMVCMVRDMADIVASMEMLYRLAGPSPGDPLQGVTPADRAHTWMTGAPIGLARRRIQNANACGYEIRYVRYPDLCTSPDVIMAGITSYLGLREHVYDFHNIEKASSEDEMAFGIPDVHRVRARLESRPSRADEILGKPLADRIRQDAADYQEVFGF